MKLWSWLHLRLLFQIIGLLNHWGWRWLSNPSPAEGRVHSGPGAGCSELCPVDFEIFPKMETPHPPQDLCPSAFLPHCENSKYLMQVPFQINSTWVTQAPELLSIRQGLSSLFYYLPSYFPNFSSSFSQAYTLNSFNFHFLFFLAPSSHWKSLSLTFWFSFNLGLFYIIIAF